MSTPDTVLTLGDFTFSRFEIPEKMPFGGDQALAIHQLVGGKKVIDAMGRIDMPLEWSGLLYGPTAEDRGRYLDDLRITGKPTKVSWGSFSYRVIIKGFHAEWQRFYQIPYTINCEVIEDLTKPVTTITSNGVDAWIGLDMLSANGYGALIGDGPLSGLLGGLDSAISTVSSFATATKSMIASVLAPLQAVQQRVSVLISSTSNVLANVSTVGGLIPGNPLSTQVAKFTGMVTGVNSLPAMYQLQSVLGRMNTNLNTVSASGQSVTVAGGDLFSMASKAYGNASAWASIASANNLTDPVLSGVNTLTVPSVPSVTNGIPNA